MTVYLVGAGPGDPGLLTMRGAELLARADVIVHDRLAEPSLLSLAPPHALRIDVGKQPGSPIPQAKINALLIEHGRHPGSVVVRLKGGDPFVFGRGGEEAQALMAAGVTFEVVPGVSAAVAAPAYAGVPLTQRGVSTSFVVVTGHRRHEADSDLNWDAIAHAAGTIVVLMGVSHRSEIAARLIAAGRSPQTPVVAVRWGTRPAQRTVRTTLAGLAEAALEPPATIVIGEVASLDLAWFEHRPLFGRQVVVTRALEQASELSTALAQLGAEVIEVPTIAIADPEDGGAALAKAAAEVASYAWVVFSSANAVHRFVPLLRDARSLGPALVAAVGPGTAEALQRCGVVADLVPQRAVAEALVEALGAPPGRGKHRVLVPRAAVGRDVLPAGLRDAGWEVDMVEAYRTVPVVPSQGDLERVADADAIAFTSSSTVTNFVAAAGVERLPRAVVCIGPVTAETARAAGIRVEAVADPHTLEGLVTTLQAVLRS